eukprot:CAMPEP_0119375262 /NCGR_PEP_ID=MMETSP1334-20130426/34709_1 /TAXON_ID=127549 /ORGANISM="Calcidiscus leptoporus, Strain RCC1130" /LENGTH=168 /DNA_ID=CAMNT_0007393517 /DNA_START=209 /DNA_END=716 /DNA_ORIENTATION=-
MTAPRVAEKASTSSSTCYMSRALLLKRQHPDLSDLERRSIEANVAQPPLLSADGPRELQRTAHPQASPLARLASAFTSSALSTYRVHACLAERERRKACQARVSPVDGVLIRVWVYCESACRCSRTIADLLTVHLGELLLFFAIGGSGARIASLSLSDSDRDRNRELD